MHKKCHFSPLRYPGGKTSLFPFFDEILKMNSLYDCTYIEPFAGGAGAAISLLLLEKVERIIINDLDPAIYAFWRSIIVDPDRFVREIRKIKITMNEWRKQKSVYNDKKSSEFALGFSAFFLNRTNYSGIIEGGPIGGMKQKGRWKLDARFNKERLIEKIERIALYKSRIKVSNLDGLDLLSKYKKEKNVFIYLDPPYCVKGGCLYLNHYVDENHFDLAQFLNKKNKLKWILTYDNVKSIKKLYSARRQRDFTLNYSARTASKGKEIMIFSDSLLLAS